MPFSVQDLVRMERISEVAVAPDGKHVVYTQRTTDMEANKGRTGIWMLDTGKRGAAPLRLIDGGTNSNRREWSKDGQLHLFSVQSQRLHASVAGQFQRNRPSRRYAGGGLPRR